MLEQNVRWQNAVRASRDRAALRTEQDRLHSLMYQSIAPGLRERVAQRRETISQLLTP